MKRHFGLVLVKMKSYTLLLALLQFLGCSGVPLHSPELETMADKGLVAALAEVNSVYAVNHLYRVTRGSVTRVIPMGLNTVDLMMVFGIKETECLKTSRNDPQTCAFRPGLFVPSFSCSSRVRMFPSSTQVVSVRCGSGTSSSSEESSEELYRRGRHHFDIPSVSRVQAPAPPQPTQSDRSVLGQPADIRPRGDALNNYLE